MGVPELDINEILGEVADVLAKKKLPPSAYDEDVHYPSEQHARSAAIAFERSIQRPYILVFFESNPGLLSQAEGRGRAAEFRDGIFDYLKKQVTVLRSYHKNGEADVLERTDSGIIGGIVRQQIQDETVRLGKQVPGTVAYSRIDSRIKYLDRWEKLCNELIDLEKSEGTS